MSGHLTDLPTISFDDVPAVHGALSKQQHFPGMGWMLQHYAAGR